MRRRTFIAGLGAAAAWPVVARGQQDRKVYRLGILTVAPERNWDGMFQELRDLGYIEGQNLIVEWRYSEGHAERWADLANALVGLKVEVIVVSTTPAALAAKNATSTVGSRPSYRSGDLVERNQPSELDCMEGSRNHSPRARTWASFAVGARAQGSRRGFRCNYSGAHRPTSCPGRRLSNATQKSDRGLYY